MSTIDYDRRSAISKNTYQLPAAEMEHRIISAAEALVDGVHDGAHHKMYAIDQAMRILLGDQYESIVSLIDGWDEGIPA